MMVAHAEYSTTESTHNILNVSPEIRTFGSHTITHAHTHGVHMNIHQYAGITNCLNVTHRDNRISLRNLHPHLCMHAGKHTLVCYARRHIGLWAVIFNFRWKLKLLHMFSFVETFHLVSLRWFFAFAIFVAIKWWRKLKNLLYRLRTVESWDGWNMWASVCYEILIMGTLQLGWMKI